MRDTLHDLMQSGVWSNSSPDMPENSRHKQ